MKIVDIAEFYSEHGGGVRTYLHQKLEASAAQGCETAIIAPGAEDRVEQRPGGRVIWVKSPTHPLDHRYHWLKVLGGGKAIHEVLDSERPEIVEASSTWQGGWIAARWKGEALKSLFLHQDPVAVYPQTFLGRGLGADRVDRMFGWFWRYLDNLSQRFDTSVVSGEWLADKLDRFGVRRPTAIPFGIEKGTFSPDHRCEQARMAMLADCGLEGREAEDAALIVAVSRHHPEKRIGTLMKAFEEVRAERPLGLYLIGDGPSRRWVESRAAQIPNIHIAGVIRDRGELATKLASADFMLHGGAAETFGLVVAEALCSGLPIVAPNVGGAADLARPSYAETYEGGDARECAAAIRRMLARDPALLRAAVARDAICALRTPGEHFQDLFKHYADLARQKREGVLAPSSAIPGAGVVGAAA